jgi:predicted nucleic acid-binding protein
MAIKLVIDTNILVSSLSSKSKYHWLVQGLLSEKFELYVTDENCLNMKKFCNKNILIPQLLIF